MNSVYPHILVFMHRKMKCADVMLMSCFPRRLFCGLSGSYTQWCPLRSEKDVRQQRPGPQRLQERDHYYGESSMSVFVRQRHFHSTQPRFYFLLVHHA